MRVLADSARLQQVLGKLVASALRHAPLGGDAKYAVRLVLDAGSSLAHISVHDNGPGLTPAARAHVFDRFGRVDGSRSRSGGGSGLGLAIAQGLVESQGGRMWVESQLGQGAALLVELPAEP